MCVCVCVCVYVMHACFVAQKRADSFEFSGFLLESFLPALLQHLASILFTVLLMKMILLRLVMLIEQLVEVQM